MRSRDALRRTLAALALLSVASGCLEWDEQELRIVYDGERDRVDAQLVTRGLFSGGRRQWQWFGEAPIEDDGAGTDEQLDQLLAGRPLFALCDGVMRCDVAAWRESTDPLVASIGAHLFVNQGQLFRDETGRLCGWQHLRVTDVAAVLVACDALLERQLARSEDAADFRKAFGLDDAASVQRFEESRKAREPWFAMRDDAFALRLPASERAARSLADRIEAAHPLQELLDAGNEWEQSHRADVEGDADAAAAGAGDAQSPARVAVTRPSEAEFAVASLHAIGVRGRLVDGGIELLLPLRGEPIALPALERHPAAERFDLAARLEKRKVAVRDDVTPALLRAKFAEFRRY